MQPSRNPGGGHGLALAALLAACTTACASAPAPTHRKEPAMIARGTFEVKLAPQPPGEGDGAVGRLLLDKRFEGDLQATSHGQMLGAQFPDGSGGYVAMEVVSGTLQGRRGTFLLQHKGTMRKGADFRMDVSTVPGSGTGELAGIEGSLEIVIEGGVHRYTLEYAFAR